MTEHKNDEAMLIARAMVEDHIYHFGMVPHPDALKDRIAKALRSAALVSRNAGMAKIRLGYEEASGDGEPESKS